ncbi:unconventional prefoldin RPB5 interactor 1-like [Mercenaria mercenaria]|uniref:unconventional prefoldin RPB5 interactor 1-like n=1 Tax=Mercenaria mercenaria TaxID=6596 RepID=UPI00234FA38E|nr:unconventional prefoldin RPB5 interactor 1-like [Mercenaria mercenaria]
MAKKMYSEHLLRLQEEQKKALQDTDDQINQWLKFKSDYEALKKRLLTLPDQVTHDVMVPFGKMAFMPGQLVHTNEILVLLGDNWFAERSAKQAAEIVDRRTKAVDKQLQELTKQKQLLEPRQQFTSELQQMSQDRGGMLEIREEYDEEKERQWKEAHRQHVREYRSRLKKEVEKQETSLSSVQTGQTGLTDEELWARLDQLEEIESERKEVKRIGTHAEKKLEGYKFPDFPHSKEKIENLEESPHGSDHSDTEESSYTASDELDSDDDEIEDDIGEINASEEELDSKGTLITFSHSRNTENSHPVAGETIDKHLPLTCPGDIYTSYIQSLKPKSILKKSPTQQKKKMKHKTKRTVVEFDTGSEDEKVIRQNKSVQQSSLEPAFSGTVVEKSVPEKSTTEMSPLQQVLPQRPVSKFKAQSANQNRDMKETVSELTNQTDSTNVKPVSKFKAQRQMIRR